MKKYLLILFLFAGVLKLRSQYAAVNFTLISQINPETGVNGSGDKYSGCWGWYQAGKNKEYAIACSKSGTYWVDITNPLTPTVSAFRLGSFTNATWREVKTYLNYCYVVSDDGGNGANSFQIFDMQYLPDSVSKVYDNDQLIRRGHAMWVDGNKLYVSSVKQASNTPMSSMNVYSLANPVSPALLRRLDQDYPFINAVHDQFVRNDTVFASCGYQGLYVFKLTSSNTFSMLGSLTSYPGSGYNHSSALTPNGQTLVFMDEVPAGLPIKVANVSNLANIQVLATTNQFASTTPHNPFVVSNQYCFASSYQEGIQLYNISNPSSPVLAGYFDTYNQGGGNTGNWGSTAYKGQWGSYPFFPSRTIFALDMSNGIFLLKTHLYENSPLTAAFNLPLSACPGKTITTLNATTGATNFTWTASGGTLLTNPNASNVSISYAAPGIYSVTLNASNPSYSSTSTQTISVADVTAAITVTNASCGNCNTGRLRATPGNGTAPFTYTWLPSGGNSYMAINLFPNCYTVTIRDAYGCTASYSKCVAYNVGLGEFDIAGDISLYPNPANNELAIDNSGLFSFSLCNSLGQVVREEKNALYKTTVSLNSLDNGIYFITIENVSGSLRKKVLIEH